MHHGKSPLFEVLGGESCLQAALRETRMVLFGAVRELLERTGELLCFNATRNMPLHDRLHCDRLLLIKAFTIIFSCLEQMLS